MDHCNQKSEGGLAIAKHFAVAGAWLALCAPLAHAGTKTMTVEQAAVQAVSVPASDLKLDVWTDRNGGVYQEGDKARVFLKVNQTARVELMDVNSAGVKTVLFPNACQPDSLVHAGQAVEVGVGGSCTGIRVSAPYGLSLLKATATTGNVTSLSGKTARSAGPFSEYAGSAADYARGMTVVISQAPQAKWATAALHYSVAPAAVAAASTTVTGASQVVVTDPATSTTVQVLASPGASTSVIVPPAPVQAAAEFTLPPLKSDFGIALTTNEASYRVGQTLSFSVSAEKRCDLRVVNIDHQGNHSILYPNRVEDSLTLTPGKTAFFPRAGGDIEIKLAGAPGKQTLLAICAQNKTFLDSLLGRSDRSAIAAVKPTITLEQLLGDSGDGLVARKAVTYQLTP